MVKKEDLEAAKSIAKKLEETLQDKLIRVVLFGSRARGDAHKDSDFDFLVIGEFTEPSNTQGHKERRDCFMNEDTTSWQYQPFCINLFIA